MSQQTLAERVGFKTASAVNKIELGLRDINQTKIIAFAKALDTTPSYLMGWEETSSDIPHYPSPTITDDVVTFPVIGEIAAGFDQVALEDYDSPDTVEIPASYLKGHPRSDYFVLRVKGNSMYPLYMDGDRVLIKKAPSLERSGEIGAVVYEEYATLKKIEYVMGEDWMKLIPINPEYQPKTITGPDLEQCQVLGVPKLLIREI